MILRWSLFATVMLATGVAFAQNPASSASSSAAAASDKQQTPPPPLTAADKPNLSYAIGYQIGSDFVERKMDIDINAVIRAMQDGYAKRKATISDETMHDLLGRMQYQMYSQAKGEFDKLAGTLEAGKAADLAVLSQDIFTVPLWEIGKTRVVMTMVGGKTVYAE